MNIWTIKFDGACWDNGSPSAKCAAAAIAYLNGKVHIERAEYLGRGTNNTAEFTGLLMAMQLLQELHAFEKATGGGDYKFKIMGDSMLAVNGFTGKFKIKHAALLPLLKASLDITLELGFRPEVLWCPRENNAEADRAAEAALRTGAACERQGWG